MNIFKFGGASVNSADAVRNMSNIVAAHRQQPLLIVVSAMGKTTNALERLIPEADTNDAERQSTFQQLQAYHHDIIKGLYGPSSDNVVTEALRQDALRHTLGKVDSFFELLSMRMASHPTTYNFDYDQTVSLGELISTTIISDYLNYLGINNRWVDVRDIIRTDANYREGNVDWDATRLNAQSRLLPLLQADNEGLDQPVVVTQGFIGGTVAHTTTTLGREGSDYSAAIMSYCLNAETMTIWKDVPGFLNADPKVFDNTIKIDQMPYNEAIEQAYYGASVIHPKTVKPLQNKGIQLCIKSFNDPSQEGSVIGPFKSIRPQCPLYIVKHDQVLLSIMPKDFSFIAEDNLKTIFSALASLNIRVNLMQNSALSFSLCIDNNPVLLKQLQELLSKNFLLRYNEHLQLITIRYYTQAIIDQMVAGKNILVQQRSRTTAQLVVSQ